MSTSSRLSWTDSLAQKFTLSHAILTIQVTACIFSATTLVVAMPWIFCPHRSKLARSMNRSRLKVNRVPIFTTLSFLIPASIWIIWALDQATVSNQIGIWCVLLLEMAGHLSINLCKHVHLSMCFISVQLVLLVFVTLHWLWLCWPSGLCICIFLAWKLYAAAWTVASAKVLATRYLHNRLTEMHA